LALIRCGKVHLQKIVEKSVNLAGQQVNLKEKEVSKIEKSREC
jgi:hypothetical protein